MEDLVVSLRRARTACDALTGGCENQPPNQEPVAAVRDALADALARAETLHAQPQPRPPPPHERACELAAAMTAAASAASAAAAAATATATLISGLDPSSFALKLPRAPEPSARTAPSEPPAHTDGTELAARPAAATLGEPPSHTPPRPPPQDERQPDAPSTEAAPAEVQPKTGQPSLADGFLTPGARATALRRAASEKRGVFPRSASDGGSISAPGSIASEPIGRPSRRRGEPVHGVEAVRRR